MTRSWRPLCVVMLALCAAACENSATPVHQRVLGADAERGREVVVRIACGVCHHIPGLAGARGIVGPPLAGFAERPLIAGTLPNRPEVLVQWVRNAPRLAPATAMPAFPLDDREARDVAAFLYTLR